MELPTYCRFARLLQFAFLMVISCSTAGDSQQQAPALVPALFIFGDSLSDNGNNNYLASLAKANFVPYGIDFPLGPTGRFTNGRTVADFLGQFMGLPFIPAYLNPSTGGQKILGGVNYASAAGGILDETGRTLGGRISFNQQIANFQNTLLDITAQLGSAEALLGYLSKSIFAVSLGSNDYINNYLQTPFYATRQRYSPDDFSNLLISEYSKQFTALYNLGARKFAVSLIGPLGCIPQQLALANSNGVCVESVNQLAENFNRKVQTLMNDLNSSLPGAAFVYQNAYNTVLDIIDSPDAYGFSVVNRGCCGVGKFRGQPTCNPLVLPCPDRNQYVFWDAYHPTEAVNLILAKKAFDGGPSDNYPINVRQLVQL